LALDATESGLQEGLRFRTAQGTFASLLLAEGRSLHYVAEQLGHGAEQTARTYGHVIAEHRDRPAIDAEAEIRVARGPRDITPASA
jgi:integrase